MVSAPSRLVKVIPLDEHLKKLRAALDAKKAKDFFYIVARTDARQALGLSEA